MKNIKKYYKVIIVAVMFLMIVCIYSFLYVPLQGQLEDLKLEASSMSYEEDMAKIQQLPSLLADIDAQKENLGEIASNFYGEFTQQQFFVELNRLISDSEIRLLSLSADPVTELTYSSGSALDGAESTPEDEDIEGGYMEMGPSQMIARRAFQMSFEAEYEQLTKFIELVDENEKRIVCEEISVRQGGGDFVLTGKRADLGNLSARIAEKEEPLKCDVQLEFYTLIDMDEFAISEDYENILEKGNILTTQDYSPFVRVIGP